MSHNRELLRRWVGAWREAGPELERLRRRDIENTNTEDAVRIIFSGMPADGGMPKRTTSGLVEQQAWFSQLRP